MAATPIDRGSAGRRRQQAQVSFLSSSFVRIVDRLAWRQTRFVRRVPDKTTPAKPVPDDDGITALRQRKALGSGITAPSGGITTPCGGTSVPDDAQFV